MTGLLALGEALIFCRIKEEERLMPLCAGTRRSEIPRDKDYVRGFRPDVSPTIR